MTYFPTRHINHEGVVGRQFAPGDRRVVHQLGLMYYRVYNRGWLARYFELIWPQPDDGWRTL